MSASLQTYTPDLKRYDELLSPDGSIRPHWRALVERLEQTGPDSVRRGAELARRLIVENGVTYNVYADPQGRDRLWTLDMLPVIVSAEEWQSIERGVIQRARLFDALLGDLYGPQRLLREGTAPAEIASVIRTICGRVMAPSREAGAGSICTPPISRVRPTGAGGCSAIARRRLPARAMRWRTGASCRVSCPICSTISTCAR